MQPAMNQKHTVIMGLILATLMSGVVAAVVVQERKQREPRKVKRVKRPQFTERDWDGIYFENLFEQGLVGARPEPQVGPAKTVAVTPGESDSEADTSGKFVWSTYLAGSTLEDEVKTIQAQLAKDVTTPVKFKSEYAKAHQSFSLLSMIFAVIREYDADVRWKKFAPDAQISFERAAANSRVGTIQAFESCKRRNQDLTEMVRGGNFAASEKAPENLDWSMVVDRNPIMKRLEMSQARLKELTSSENAFKKDTAKVYHESQLVAAMAQVLMRENMQDAEDDDYCSHSKLMCDSALSAAKACQTQNYDDVSKAVNTIGQSCSNCHDEWR